jgi:uncharacterized cupredoxin-like copper-binding protein
MGLKGRGRTGRPFGAPAWTLVAVASLLLPAACTPDHTQAGPVPQTVQVTELDFQISAPNSVRSGDLLLHVDNKGPDWHELIIARTDKQLPLRSDGLTVNEEALQSVIVGALEPAEAGVHDLRVHLTAGHYQFFCNMAGHFMAGMYGTMVVQ